MSAIGENPYVGAQPLSAKNQLFGRNREVRDLFFLLCKERIVLMYAPSGAGKSSLLEAQGGLLGHLDERFDVWPVTRVNTQSSVLCRNQYVFSALLGFERAAPPEHMRSEDQLAGLTLREGVLGRWRHPDEPATMLLVFDQFEEIFRLNPADVEGQKEFFRQLGELLMEPSIWALLVMREDYLAAIDPFCRQVPTHLRNRFRLDLLGREAATLAIAETAKTEGRYWEKDAVDWVVNDLARIRVQPMQGAAYNVAGQYVEPLQLQVVCRDLWEKLAPDDESFGMDDMSKIGNVDMALAGYYRRSVRDVSQGNIGVERAIRTWFGSELISPGHVRGQVLRGQSESGGLANGLIEALVAKHIVRAEKRGGATWYELSHDRLIPAVEGCNLIWFEKNLSDLERRVELWMAQAKTADLLVTGSVLRAFNKWAKQNANRVHENERAFLYQSKRENGKVWFRRGLVGVIVVCMLVSIRLTFKAKAQTDQANYNAALHSDSRAEEAVARGDWDEAWLYTLASINVNFSTGFAIPESFGRLMRFEISPRSDWRQHAKLALGKVGRVNDADEILFVATNSKTTNHSGAILQQYTDSGFNVYRTSPDMRTLSLTGIFSYKFDGQGKFGKDFTGELYCAEVDGKRYYAGANQIVEEAALVNPSQGRSLAAGDSHVLAMKQSSRGLAVLTKDGRLRFADVASMKWRHENAEIKLEAQGLAGFDVAGDDLAVIYDTKTGLKVWKIGNDLALTQRAHFPSFAGFPYRVVSIVSNDPLVVAYGSDLGAVGLVSFADSEWGKTVASAKLHQGAVIQLSSAGSASGLGEELVSVGAEGDVRHIPMQVRFLDGITANPIWLLATDSSDGNRWLFSDWQQKSLKILPFTWIRPDFLRGNMSKLVAARSELYGRDSLYQNRHFDASELLRRGDGKWTWKTSAGESLLTEKRWYPTGIILDSSGLEIDVPLNGAWVTVNGIAFAKVAERSSGRFKLAPGYLLDMGKDRWHAGAGGDISPPVLRLIRMPKDESVLRGDSSSEFVLPRGEGPLKFRPAPDSQAVPLGTLNVKPVYFINDPWESKSSPHAIKYQSVSVNGSRSNAIRVLPGQAVTVSARWSIVVGADKTKQQNFFLGMSMPEGAFSRCIASAGGERPMGRRGMGTTQITFRMPSKPGWYFLTHATHAGDKCEAAPPIHATGPDNAVAAILVEETDSNDRSR